MSRVSKFIVVIFLVVTLIGCQRKINSQTELIQFISANDYPIKDFISTERYNIEVRYIPSQFFYYKMSTLSDTLNKNNSNTISGDDQKNIENNISNNYYFQLTIKNKIQGEDIYSEYLLDKGMTRQEWVQRLNFGLKEQIFIVTSSGNTIAMSQYRLEPSYGFPGACRFLLVFPRYLKEKKWESGKEIKLKMREFGLNIGKITFNLPWPPSIIISEN